MNFFLPCFLLSSLIAIAAGHGFMNKPNIRGSLQKSKFIPQSVDEDAPKDYWAHFPAGDKDSDPGSGLRSQIRQAGPKGWTPFTPRDSTFRWRAGVCGDEKIPGKKQAHLRGGQYYYDAKIVATYRQGATIEIGLSIIAHHNGFIQLHMCDVQKCDGEISEDCFKKGHCTPLMRAPNRECDSGKSKECGPIDRNYPERWYLPCTTVGEDGWEIYGDDTIKYRLPEDLTCEHCVLHMFWTAANTCNPPGVVEYFDGPDAPEWGTCRGQGGAIGGVTRVQRPCGPDRFPEEYYNCADVRIVPGGPNKVEDLAGVTAPTPSSSPVSSPKPSYSSSPRPSPEPSQSKTPRPSPEPSQSKTPRPSPEPSQSKTPQPSPEPSQSKTPRPSPEPSQSESPRPSPKASQSNSPWPSPSASLSSSPRASPKASRSSTPRPSPKPSRSGTPRPSPIPSRSGTPRPSRSSTPRPSASKRAGGNGKKAIEPSPSESPVPSPSASPSLSPVSVTDLEFLSSSIEPSFSPEESPEASISPEAEFSPEPSSDDYGFGSFEPSPRNGLITDLIFVADGKEIGSVVNGDIIDISGYGRIALKAVTKRKVEKVEFYVNGEKVWTEHHMEYYLFGNSETSPFYWREPPVNMWIEVVTVAETEEDVVNIMFTK